MPDADKQLKILLEVQANVADLSKVTAGLATTTTELQTVAAASTQLGSSVATATTEMEGAAAAGSELGAALGTAFSGAVFAGVGLLLAGFSQIPGLIEHAADEQVKWSEEIRNQAEALSQQVPKWAELSQAATKFGDVVKLADKIAPDLESAAQLYESFRNTQLSAWKSWGESISNILVQIATQGLVGVTGRFSSALKSAQDSAGQQLQTVVNSGNAVISNAQKQVADRARIEAEPVKDGIDEVSASIDTLKAKLATFDQQRHSSDPLVAKAAIDGYKEVGTELERQQGLLDSLNKKQEVQAAEAEKTAAAITKSKDQTALLNAQASGNEQAVIADRVAQRYDEVLKAKLDALVPEGQAKELATQEATALQSQLQHQLDIKNARAGARDAAAAEREQQQLISASLRDEGLQLQAIRGLMQAIDQDPFATVFDKAEAKSKLIPLDIQKIEASSKRLQGEIKGGILDPQQLEQARAKLLQNDLQVVKLANDFKQIGFGGMLRTDLTAWVNQFGTTAHQIAGLITSSIGTAVSGVSSAISGAIFKTESWGEAFDQTAQSIVSNLLNIVLQWGEQQPVMLALHAIFGETAAATTAAVAAQTAAAWAPGATAASIATYGVADATGIAALAGAMATGQGIVTGLGGGGFASGGYTGAGMSNAVAGLVHRNEYVMDSRTVDRAGGAGAFDRLRVAINSPNSSNGSGARSGLSRSASAPSRSKEPRKTLVFFDLDALMQEHQRSSGYVDQIVHVLNRRGGNFRT